MSVDDVAGTICRQGRMADVARHVKECHLFQETRINVDVVAGNAYLSLPTTFGRRTSGDQRALIPPPLPPPWRWRPRPPRSTRAGSPPPPAQDKTAAEDNPPRDPWVTWP